MRKSPAILFLALLSFNLAGYRLWLSYAQIRSDRRMEAVLDHQDYDSSELITIRMPFSMPYANTGAEFEPTAGEIELDGKIYKFVKRRIYEGELILLCLPDQHKTRLRAAGIEYYKGVNDLSGLPGAPTNQRPALKQFQNDYDDQAPKKWLSGTLKSQPKYPSPLDHTFLPSPAYAVPGRPPDRPMTRTPTLIS